MFLMGLQRFPYKRFTGLNTRDSPYELESSESPDCEDVCPIDYYTLQGLKSRHGSKVWAPAITGLVGNISAGIYWPKWSMFVVVSNGDIWSANFVGGAATKRFDATDAQTQWTFAIAEDSAKVEMLWMHTASPSHGETPQKWDGVTALTTAWLGGTPLDLGTATQGPYPMVYWKNRILMGGMDNKKSRLHYSDKGNPETPVAAAYGNNFIDFLDDDSSLGISALVPHQESCMVFREKGIWQIYDQTTFANKRLIVGQGCQGRHHACSHPNGRVYFLSGVDNQLYSISLRGDLILESDKIFADLASLSVASGDQVLLGPRLQVILRKTGSGSPTYEFVPFAKPGEGAWFRHRFAGAAVNHFFHGVEMTSANQRSIMGNQAGDTNLRIYFSNTLTDVQDTGTDFDPYWLTSWRPFISEEPLERLRRIHAIYGGQVALDIFAEMAPVNNASPKQSYTLADVTNVDNRAFSLNRPETRGRYHAVKIKGVSAKRFEIDELEFAFRGGKEHA